MKRVISSHTKSTTPGFSKRSARAAAMVSVVLSSCVASIGPSGLGLLGVSGLITIATPAQAQCVIKGVLYHNIPRGPACLEAQQTGCVRHMLTPEQYRQCLLVNQQTQQRGCLVKGIIRYDIPPGNACSEAQQTGCVRHLLTPQQYTNCM